MDVCLHRVSFCEKSIGYERMSRLCDSTTTAWKAKRRV
ncbi:hypothetical protein FM112_02810 [Gulosibacter sp. 10]|nr:hypothetical protein FM112_02810 [Gulosibacter sp. 10]